MVTLLKKTGQKGRSYPHELRDAALRDYLSGMSRSEVGIKYSLRDLSILSHWKRKFASISLLKDSSKMVKRRNKRILLSDMESAQSKRIKELERALSMSRSDLLKKEKELKDALLSGYISETMIDMAEEVYGIHIRKNSGSK